MKSAAAAAGAAWVGPTFIPSSVFGAKAPSNRITMGCIGVGIMGSGNLKGFMGKADARVVAVCDVDSNHRERARKMTGLGPASAYNDFRDLLERQDIDTVVISTPDHWHVPISIAAAKAGKDIYCEKPLTLTIAEGRILCDAVKRYGRILQTGSQLRSDSKCRFGCELVRNGRIGKLHTIRVKIPGNNRTCPNIWHAMPVPEGFDYNMWLGSAPREPYTKLRCHYTFRFIFDYSGGQMTNFGAHTLDIAQWGNGTDLSGPVVIVGRGEFPKDGLFNTATDTHVEYNYANGVKVISQTGGFSVRFEGSEGWVFVSSGQVDAYPKSLLESKIRPNEIHLYRSKSHKQNFLDCVKLRKKPVASVEIGHRSATVCHLGNIAMLLGRKLNWDPERERFINDDEANQMLYRSMRSPWCL